MVKLNEGMFLWEPKNNWLIEITEIYTDTKQNGIPWFGYYVLQGYTGKDNLIHPIDQGSRKHNGWDYTNELLTWILLTKEMMNSPARKILYGKS